MAGVALLAMLALGAVAASAQATEGEMGWVVHGELLPEGVKVEVPCEQAEALEIKSKVLATAFDVKYEEVSCVGWKLWNTGGHALSSGKLKLSKPTIVSPAGCKTEAVTTNTLAGKVEQIKGLGTELGERFVPEVGETLATINIAGCALAGTYPLRGSEVAEMEPLNTFKEIQPFLFDEAIEKIGGSGLKIGKETARLTGRLDFEV
jgi:hypothetical protein